MIRTRLLRPRLRTVCIELPRPSRRHNSSDNGNAQTDAYASDARVRHHVRRLIHEYDNFREKYNAPKNPVVFCHGLLGFDTIRLAGNLVPGIEYWRGIKEVLQHHGVEVITCAVPPSASIEERAEVLAKVIEEQAKGRGVNMIGGIDARYMISKLRPNTFKVHSLTTITTPHRGSPFADYLLSSSPLTPLITPLLSPTAPIRTLLTSLSLSTGAFPQLTTSYMTHTFNPSVPNDPLVKYYSYGACFEPEWYSMFRLSHKVVEEKEGENDGLVSAKSAMWGEYEGTVVGASHLEVINWYNRMKWTWAEVKEKVGGLIGEEEEGKGGGNGGRGFNAVAFYCDVVERLADRGF